MQTGERTTRFGVGFHLDEEPTVISEYIKLAENLDFECAWISDIYSHRNAWVTLAAAATQTKRIKLGTAVANLYLRHPIVTASAVATLDELSNGRAALGIGSGGKFMEPLLGVDMSKSFTACKETIAVIKELLKGESVQYFGEVFKLNGAKLVFKSEKIPIYIGARGPKMHILSGEVADGIIIHGVSLKYLRIAIEHIRKGAETTGRNLSEIDIAVMTPLVITKDSVSTKEVLRPWIASQALGVSPKTSNWYDLDERDMENIKLLRKAYSRPFSKKASQLVRDEMIDAFSIVGSREECLSKVEEMVRTGVTQIIITPLPDIKRSIEQLAEFIRYYKSET